MEAEAGPSRSRFKGSPRRDSLLPLSSCCLIPLPESPLRNIIMPSAICPDAAARERFRAAGV